MAALAPASPFPPKKVQQRFWLDESSVSSAPPTPIRTPARTPKATTPNSFAPWLHTDLRRIHLRHFILVSFTCTVLAGTTLFLTSDLSPLGRIVYKALQERGDYFAAVSGFHCHNFCLGMGLGLLLLGYLLDIARWQGSMRLVAVAFICSAMGLICAGLLFYTNSAPALPIIIGVVLTLLATVAIRRYLLHSVPVTAFSFACGVSFFLLGFTILVIWILWVFTSRFGGYNTWKASVREDYVKAGFMAHTGFVMWCSPAILGILYLIASMFAIMRGRFHVPRDNDSTAWTDIGESDEVYVGRELKFVITGLVLFVLFCWIAASVAASDLELGKTVLRVSCAMFLTIIVYIYSSVSQKEMERVAEENDTVLLIIEFARSDWMRGLSLLLLWPLVPAYFVVEFFHQRMRNLLVLVDIIESRSLAEGFWLTREAEKHWQWLNDWNWSSILCKSMYWGILYFVVQVGVATGVTIFLSWLSDYVQGWNLGSILVLLFFVGLSLFLLPPVPGLPIYLISGIVVVRKCEQDGVGFVWGCVIATVFCFAIKLVSNILLQKLIGDVFSENITVRKAVGVYSPTMKAVERVLTQGGLQPDKVAVLIGGPDWPTAVMTGILKIRLADMLIGSFPCFFLILPVVVAAAFMLKAREVPEEQQQEYQCIANVMMMLAAVVQGGAMVVAGMYLQQVKDQYRVEFDTVREEDVAVIQAVEAEQEQFQVLVQKTGWHVTPTWLRTVLFLGSWDMCFMMHIVMEPFIDPPPFRKFRLNDHISDLPGGQPLGVINLMGWVSIGALLFGCACLAMYRLWVAYRGSWIDADWDEPADEVSPLLLKD
mmetsp:Transcript_32085/g.88437  ORF Transcript_32085/g.88437 Transcript_32085/m.88437 type:complete len:824 (-) Transcript_32085:93-2564(-)